MTSSEGYGSTYRPEGSGYLPPEQPVSGGYLPPPVPPLNPPTFPSPGYAPPVDYTGGNPASGNFESSPQQEQPSTAGVAKEQAASVAGSAADAAKNVAGTAKEQVGQVATEAKKQVKDLVGQARTELTDQAQVQQERVAGGLKSVGDQLRALADGTGEPGPANDIAHQAADKVHEIAAWFENRDPGTVLADVKTFARQRPGAFLGLSLAAGVLVGRLAKGLAADPEQNTGHAPQDAAPAALGSGYRAQPALGTGATYPPAPGSLTAGADWSSGSGLGR
jgi:hypothetical protein